jgi:UDP-glucose 4-epimerase
VYGAAEVPITEDTPAGAGITNAYGRTKYMIEEILKVQSVERRMGERRECLLLLL